MADKKGIKSEIKRNLRTIAILIIVIILIYFDISITKLLNFTQDKKIIWTLDFGIYNILVSMLFSVIYYFYKGAKLHIKIDILNKKEDTNEITIRDNPEEIYMKLNVEGKYKKFSSKIEIYFPHWIDVQTKPRPFLSFDEDNNTYLIDLESLILNKENISLTESITFDVLKNTDEKNKDLIEAKLKLGLFTKFFKVALENKGIKIKSK
ncbi:hypothetical protein RGU12_11775 [Fredinandcohnia sp. QZ13]|uniref:hypothetical protein n=1 Tax=Fredinandcohnia sp. QZ13 TaxID=3073144 RepID=UPI00285364F4|nr:hypothetical protein [Fredinandcohnia sp. QZ13]MDR4888230.1 hypothetical protein [Fredinandcohnia sp. QZ13]